MDHYPDFDADDRANKTKEGYIANMMALRAASLEAPHPLPFWNFFNVMPYGAESQFDISESEVRWQVFTSLAIGARGVLYFCYWTPAGETFVRGQAIMTPMATDLSQQRPSPKYEITRRVNSKLKILGNFLLNKTSSSVQRCMGGRSDTIAIDNPFVRSINGTNVGDSWSFLLGFFEAGSVMVLTNQDSNHPALASLEASYLNITHSFIHCIRSCNN